MDAAMPGAEFVPGLSLELGSSTYRNLSVFIIGSEGLALVDVAECHSCAPTSKPVQFRSMQSWCTGSALVRLLQSPSRSLGLRYMMRNEHSAHVERMFPESVSACLLCIGSTTCTINVKNPYSQDPNRGPPSRARPGRPAAPRI